MKAKLHTRCALCGRPFDDQAARFERESGACDACTLNLFRMRYQTATPMPEPNRAGDRLAQRIAAVLWVGIVLVCYALYVVNTGG